MQEENVSLKTDLESARGSLSASTSQAEINDRIVLELKRDLESSRAENESIGRKVGLRARFAKVDYCLFL